MGESQLREAEVVLRSEAVFTGMDDRARPAAVGMAGDRIVWMAPPHAVGSARFPMAAGAQVHDLGARFIMPGFHDAHLHVFHAALYGSDLAERIVGTSEVDCVAALGSLAARRPPGSWLLTQGWREQLWDVPVLPSKASLDAAFPDRPVAMYSGDAHTLWLNTCAMERLGLHRDACAPEGGSYDRDAQGELTGIVREAAAMQLMPRIVEGFEQAELLGAYEAFQARLNAWGITSVCDMALTALPGADFVRDDLFVALADASRLTVRVHLFPTLAPQTTRVREMQERSCHPLIRTCGCKQFFDGVSSQHTAWLDQPYANARIPGDVGQPTVEPAALAAMVAHATGQGYGVRIHTIGDAAIHAALDIFADVRARDEQVVLTLEHVENFQPTDIARMADLGVVASVQPRHMTLDPGGPERDLGPARVPYMWPLRSLLDAGAVLAFGSDAPVTDPDPLKAVYAAVTRKDAVTRLPEDGWLSDQRITPAEALRAYTQGSAAACGRQHELGTLAPDMLADVVVLDADPCAVHPEEIPDIPVYATYVGGMCVFQA